MAIDLKALLANNTRMVILGGVGVVLVGGLVVYDLSATAKAPLRPAPSLGRPPASLPARTPAALQPAPAGNPLGSGAITARDPFIPLEAASGTSASASSASGPVGHSVPSTATSSSATSSAPASSSTASPSSGGGLLPPEPTVGGSTTSGSTTSGTATTSGGTSSTGTVSSGASQPSVTVMAVYTIGGQPEAEVNIGGTVYPQLYVGSAVQGVLVEQLVPSTGCGTFATLSHTFQSCAAPAG